MPRITLIFLLTMTLPAVARAQPWASAPAIDVETFIAQLDAMADRVERASAADLRALADDVPPGVRVRDGEEEWRVRFDPVRQRIADAEARPESWPAIRKEVGGRLAAMRLEAAERRPVEHAVDAAAVRAALDSVLARPEFARAARRSWTAVLRERLSDWVSGLWSRLGGDRLNSRRVGQVLAWLAVLVALISIVWILRRWSRLERSPLHIADGGLPATASREWAARALAAAASGDSREAIRCAYRAAVRRIEEQGGWRADASRTPREYGALLRTDDVRAVSFRALAKQFELAWFARRALSSDDMASMTDSLERLGCLRVRERAI